MGKSKDKLIITGSHGFIGKVLTPALKEKYDVFEINRSGTPSKRYYPCDVGNLKALQKNFKKIGPVKYLIHAAAASLVKHPWELVNPSNIEGTLA